MSLVRGANRRPAISPIKQAQNDLHELINEGLLLSEAAEARILQELVHRHAGQA
jgi:hypothetical protein